MCFLKLLFSAFVFFQSFGVFASSDSDPSDTQSDAKNNIVMTDPQKVQTVQSKEGIVKEASFEILPEEGHNQLKFLPITLSAKQYQSLHPNMRDLLNKINTAYKRQTCDQNEILGYIVGLYDEKENKEVPDTLPAQIWISICARCFELKKEGSYENEDNMSIICNSFGDPDYRKISTNLFEYRDKNVSGKILYAIGVYLHSIKNYDVLNSIQTDQVSFPYRVPLSKLNKEEWPENFKLCWCFDNAWNDSVTQDNAEKYNPVLF